MPPDDKTQGRLSRWSRQKLANAKAEAVPAVDVEQVVPQSSPQEVERQAAEAAALEAQLAANRQAAEAVDLTALDESSDFSVFLKEGVPKLLKKQAMAALWRSNPVYANVDGLVDYGEDFGSPDLIMKTFKSAWQAGRGYLKAVEEFTEGEAEDKAVASVDVDDPEAGEEALAGPDETAILTDGETPLPVSDDAALLSEPSENSAQFAEIEDAEPVPAPKVSLRRRLMMEENG